MEILVCIKQVPDDSVEISLNEATGKPALDDVTPVVNAFDTYAEEMAVRLKEAVEGEVTVVSIGDDSVKKFPEKLSCSRCRPCIPCKNVRMRKT